MRIINPNFKWDSSLMKKIPAQLDKLLRPDTDATIKQRDHSNSMDDLRFCNEVLERLKINIVVEDHDLMNLQKQRVFVTVSNCPFGGVDAIIISKLMLELQSEFKMLNNEFVETIDNIKSLTLSSRSSELTKLKAEINEQLQQGNPIHIFPAEKTLFNAFSKTNKDLEWSKHLISLIKEMDVVVVPIYIDSSNTRLYKITQAINGVLKNLKFPSKIGYKTTDIKVRIGSGIDRKTISNFDNIPALTRYLRARTYVLGTDVNLKQFKFKNPLYYNKENDPQEIIHPVKKDKLKRDIFKLSSTHLIDESSDFALFCVQAEEIPYLIGEIGRLREKTFRAIGEGTNKTLDLDSFDWHYKHLFLWHKETSSVAGAYRLGMGKEIIKT
ncbi:MAG: lysophospholipid acyltransferase family protein, partial [Flavobacteriales bacterium]|nr:lysophospholipid acyltransferase family protein [Flavobacteriales bacterium]